MAQTATEEAVDWELTSLVARDPHGAHVTYAAVQPGGDVSAGGLYATGHTDSGNRNEEEHNHAGALDLSLQMQVGASWNGWYVSQASADEASSFEGGCCRGSHVCISMLRLTDATAPQTNFC